MRVHTSIIHALRHACLTLLILAIPVAAATPPYTARYELTRNGSPVGELIQKLTISADGSVVYASRTTPKGVLAWLLAGTVEERTVLERAEGRLRPLNYRHDRLGIGPDRIVEIAFDWDRQRVRNVIDGDPWVMQIAADTFDKHALLLAVSEDLAAGALHEAYPVADGGKLKQYRFINAGTEEIETPAGRFETIVVQRRRGNKTTGTDFWHAPSLGHLPVRVERLLEDGDRYLLVLQNIELAGNR